MNFDNEEAKLHDRVFYGFLALFTCVGVFMTYAINS